MTDAPTRPTTAAVLAAYRDDLESKGFDGNLIDALVLDAATHLHRDGLAVTTAPKAEQQTSLDQAASERRARRAAELAEAAV